MAEQEDFWIRFWGVRGSIACPGGDTLRYGGNTSCIEVQCGSRLLILDCGTGARMFGNHLQAPVDADLFFSHTHFDHVCGVPFFAPNGTSERLTADVAVPRRAEEAPLDYAFMEAIGRPVPGVTLNRDS